MNRYTQVDILHEHVPW